MRQRITTDVSTGGGQFDVIFIGLYEAPIFAKRGWLKEMENIPAEYDIEDVFKSSARRALLRWEAVCVALQRREFDVDVSKGSL